MDTSSFTFYNVHTQMDADFSASTSMIGAYGEIFHICKVACNSTVAPVIAELQRPVYPHNLKVETIDLDHKAEWQ